MKLNDFNRYADDFTKEAEHDRKVIAGGGLRFLDQQLANMRKIGLIDRQAQMSGLQQQNSALQQQVVASTSVASTSSLGSVLGGLGQIIPLRGIDE